MLLYALAKAGQHAELLRVKLQHPSISYNNNSYYGLGMADMYGMASPYGSHYHQPYPIHDPYWYSRNIHDPYDYSHQANYHRRYPYRSTSSFGFAPIRKKSKRFQLVLKISREASMVLVRPPFTNYKSLIESASCDFTCSIDRIGSLGGCL
ncbi:hypothetical protein AgCh_007387 [Apium graveolens]